MAASEYGIIDYVTNNTDSFNVVPYNDIDTAVFTQIANNPRYENVMVSDYVENPAKNNTPGYTQLSQDLVDNEQFAAMTMSMDIDGETLNLAKCIDYLNETADDFERTKNEIAGFFE